MQILHITLYFWCPSWSCRCCLASSVGMVFLFVLWVFSVICSAETTFWSLFVYMGWKCIYMHTQMYTHIAWSISVIDDGLGDEVTLSIATDWLSSNTSLMIGIQAKSFYSSDGEIDFIWTSRTLRFIKILNYDIMLCFLMDVSQYIKQRSYKCLYYTLRLFSFSLTRFHGAPLVPIHRSHILSKPLLPAAVYQGSKVCCVLGSQFHWD